MQLSVRDVNEKVFREFKAKVAKEGMTVGQALTLAMEKWVDEESKKASLLSLKPTRWGDKGNKTSERVDEILYGA